jgi:hypothetical protein
MEGDRQRTDTDRLLRRRRHTTHRRHADRRDHYWHR